MWKDRSNWVELDQFYIALVGSCDSHVIYSHVTETRQMIVQHNEKGTRTLVCTLLLTSQPTHSKTIAKLTSRTSVQSSSMKSLSPLWRVTRLSISVHPPLPPPPLPLGPPLLLKPPSLLPWRGGGLGFTMTDGSLSCLSSLAARCSSMKNISLSPLAWTCWAWKGSWIWDWRSAMIPSWFPSPPPIIYKKKENATIKPGWRLNTHHYLVPWLATLIIAIVT